MTKAQKAKDWLNWFKLSVTQARDARLAGKMTQAMLLDEIVERYYPDGPVHGFSEDFLFEIESNIRG